MSNRGALVISLDFELHWGVRDKVSVEQYSANLLGARKAIPAILDLFQQYNIHATWAIVGFLFCRNRDELLAAVPSVLPQYNDRKLSPYRMLQEIGENERADPFHYASSLVDLISESPGQEIGTHTLSHFYCLEPGQTAESFRQDLRAARRVAEARGIAIRSIVFPRNQCNPDYLSLCRKEGITSYRGTPQSYAYIAGAGSEVTSFSKRAIRYLDAYLPICRNWYSRPPSSDERPINIPASRFLRPYTAGMSRLHLTRVKRELTTAAKSEAFYHLWWHPHNFGRHTQANLGLLEDILEHVTKLRDLYGFQSLNMAEAGRCAELCWEQQYESTNRSPRRAEPQFTNCI